MTAKLFKEEFCGIIFVQRRDTAAALAILLQEYEPFREIIRVQALAGHHDGKDPVLRTSAKDQSTIISKFRDGAYNLLVSTCVAEEGLDIQPCNIVIRYEPPLSTSLVACGQTSPHIIYFSRFDPVTTTTSYIQSRGRARKTNSRYFMMQEMVPDESVRDLEDTALVRLHRGEQLMRDWCRKQDIEGFRNDPNIRESTPAGISHLKRIYRVPSTQAVLTLDSAIPLLDRFCILIARDDRSDWKPVFDVFPSGSSFSCVLTLPPNGAVRVVQSDRTATKDLARMHAAFKACEALHKAGALDDHLEPIGAKVSLGDDTKVTAPSFRPDQTSPYPHYTPSFWTSGLPKDTIGSRKVFLCTIALEVISARDALRYQPMYLITAKRLSFSKHSFNVYVRGEVHKMTLTVSKAPLILAGKQLDLLRQYTLTIFQRIMRKKVGCLEDMPFMLAPISGQDPFEQVIDWNEVEMGQSLEPKAIERRTNTDDKIKEMVVTVRNQHMCDYFIIHVVREHHLDDIMPATRFKKELEAWSSGLEGDPREPTFRQYFLWKFKVECDNDEVIIQVQQIHRFRNHLQPEINQPKEKALVLVPLSACRQSTVTANVLRVAQLVPSAIFDLDDLLLVQEAQKSLHLQSLVKLDILQVALTTSAANRDFSYQRLELLGDSFLKFSSTIRLYIIHSVMNEGQLHIQRTKIISNAALREHALRLELYKYVANGTFQRRTWMPVKFVVDGKVRADDEEHLLSNKTLADIVESTLGAALLSGGVEAALACAKALGIPFSEFDTWADFGRIHSELAQHSDFEADQTIARSEAFQDRLHSLEQLLHYTFQHPSLAQEAMTHHSAVAQPGYTLDYQRLEFLGDAVLEFIVVSYYYEKYPDAPPGAITLIKDSSVNNQILGAMAVAWGLSGFLIHMSESLAGMIERVIVAIETIKEKSASGALEGQYWVDLKMPKVLGDIVESVLGAVFVDCGFSVARITEIFGRLVHPFLDTHVDLDRIVLHPVKCVSEHLQVHGCSEWRLELVDEREKGATVKTSTLRRLGIGRESHRDPPVLAYRFLVHGSVIASGSGPHGEEVRKQVAVEAMRRLKTEPGLLESLCSCAKCKKQHAGRGTMLDKYQEAHSLVSMRD